MLVSVPRPAIVLALECEATPRGLGANCLSGEYVGVDETLGGGRGKARAGDGTWTLWGRGAVGLLRVTGTLGASLRPSTPGRSTRASERAMASTHASASRDQRCASRPRSVSRPDWERKARFVTRTMPRSQRVSMTFIRLSDFKKPGEPVRTAETMMIGASCPTRPRVRRAACVGKGDRTCLGSCPRCRRARIA